MFENMGEQAVIEGQLLEQVLFLFEGGTVCSNGIYADISNHHQMQQYKSCLKWFLKSFGTL